MADTINISDVRLQARPTYSAEFLTVEGHERLDVDPAGNFIERPDGLTRATHLKFQALVQNIRYTISGQASITFGFQLTAGQETTIPVPNNGISVFEEVAGAIIQYQWLR